ncbi:MAG: hypothetical protein ABI597_12215 [Gammaproteobacteria bacterium]
MNGRQMKKIGTSCYLIATEIGGLRSEDKAEIAIIDELNRMNIGAAGTAIEDVLGDAADDANNELILTEAKSNSFIKKIEALYNKIEKACDKLSPETKTDLQPLLDDLYTKLHPNAPCQSIIEDIQVDSNGRLRNGLQMRLSNLLEKISGINRFKSLREQVRAFDIKLKNCGQTEELSVLSGEEFPKLESEVFEAIFANFKSRLDSLEKEYPKKRDKILETRAEILDIQEKMPFYGKPTAGQISDFHEQIKRLQPTLRWPLFKRPSPSSSPSPSPSSSVKDDLSPSSPASSMQPSTLSS